MAEKEPFKVELPADKMAELDKMAASLDAGESGEPVPEPVAEPETTEAEPETTESEPETPEIKVLKTPKGERKVDPKTGKFIPSKPKAEKIEEGVILDEPQSEYAKAKKEEERQRGVLSKFEEEKKATREAQSKKERELAEREKKLQLTEAQRRPRAVLNGYNADQYMQAARDFAKDGDHENAFKAQEAAVRLYTAEQQQMGQQREQAVKAAFEADMQKVIDDEPILKNGDDPLSMAVKTVLEQYPELYYLKNGFTKAVSVAKKFMDADNAAELRTKVESLESELEKLRKATTPSQGGPTGPAKEKKISEMSAEEGMKHLERVAEELDRVA